MTVQVMLMYITWQKWSQYCGAANFDTLSIMTLFDAQKTTK